MYFLGVPAPVVTIPTPSSIITSIISFILCIINIKFTANGLSVYFLQLTISSLNCSGLIPPDAIIPSPPALDTADAS